MKRLAHVARIEKILRLQRWQLPTPAGISGIAGATSVGQLASRCRPQVTAASADIVVVVKLFVHESGVEGRLREKIPVGIVLVHIAH